MTTRSRFSAPVRRAITAAACIGSLSLGGTVLAQDDAELPAELGDDAGFSAAPNAAAAVPAAGVAGGGEEAGDEDQPFLNPDDYVPRSKIARVRGLKSHVPEVHRVRSGDTLWQITGTYFRNPYLWPALWSYNPQITNPHWIYPDDLVFLRPVGATSADASLRDLFALSNEIGIMVLPVGYYTQEDLTGARRKKDGEGGGGGDEAQGEEKKRRGPLAGRVIFSPEEKTMLTLNDEAYIDWPDAERRKSARAGQRYAIYHQLPAVVDPDTDEEVAVKLKLVGTLQVAFNDGRSLPSGVITDAVQEIERGDLLLPWDEALFRLMPTPNESNAEGRIIDTFELITQLGEQQFVLLDLGEDHHVRVGNRFLVFEQREGLVELPPGKKDRHTSQDAEQEEAKKPKGDEDEEEERRTVRPGDRNWPLGDQPEAPRFPEPEDDEDQFPHNRDYTEADLPLRQIGEVIVVKTSAKFATGLIVDSRREFNLGQRVTLLAGF